MPRLAGCLLLAASARLLADGGMVVLHQESPPFVITVFASPTPPRAGTIDLSVLLQASETLEPVLDAEVQIELISPQRRGRTSLQSSKLARAFVVGDLLERSGSQIRVRATRDQAQNKLLYAASVPLDDAGDWRYTVFIRTAGSASTPISGILTVAAEQPKLAAYWGYLALPFLCLAVFALHQWLRWGKRASTGL